MALYKEGGPSALPPVEVTPLDGDTYLLADGHHRVAALEELKADEIRGIVLRPPDGRDAQAFAYERALATAGTAPKPLTRAEKRSAVDRLIQERSDLSDREIARLARVSHPFVGRRRHRLETLPVGSEDPGEAYLTSLSAYEIAQRLVRDIDRLWESRELSDLVLGDRTAKRLASALRERHGGNALRWAKRFLSWARAAVAELEREDER